jgi:restriction system protein
MEGHEFEEILIQLFQEMGYQVKRPPLARDKGADLICEKPGERLVIQAKCYGTNAKVGIAAIQQILGAVKFYQADRGVVVTNSYFTSDAQELAKANKIGLWDRDILAKILHEYPLSL